MKKPGKWGRVLCLAVVLIMAWDVAVRLLIFCLPLLAEGINGDVGEILLPLQSAKITFGWVAAVPLGLLLSFYAVFAKRRKVLFWLLLVLLLLVSYVCILLVTCVNGVPVYAGCKAVMVLL